MTDLIGVVATDLLERVVRPLVFGSVTPADPPSLVLLSGVAGSGSSRGVGRLLAELPDGAAVVRADDLSATARGLADAGPDGGLGSEVTADWLRGCIRFARESSRSVILDGTLRTPAAVDATVTSFAARGFETRVVLVGSRRADALMSTVSEQLLRVHNGRQGMFEQLSWLEEAIAAQHLVADQLASVPELGRVSVWGPQGDVVYDSDPVLGRDAGTALQALTAVEAEPMSTMQAVAWLGELRRTTTYSEDIRDRDPALTRALIDLHELAIQEVLPVLKVNADSQRGNDALMVQEAGSIARLITLRASLPDEPRLEAPAPDLTGPTPSRGLSL